MVKPWKAIDEMDHDELRRYARFLVQAWVDTPPDGDLSELMQHLTRVGERMEEVGMDPIVSRATFAEHAL